MIDITCTKCDLHRNRTHVVIGEGKTSSGIVLVGECPGPDEDKANRPFVGLAGKLLRECLLDIGVKPENIYLTNIVKCFPFHSLNPSKRHIQACSPYLDKQLSETKPELIVSIGRISSEYFLAREIKMTKESGKIIEFPNFNLLPVIHPSYIMRNGGHNRETNPYAKKFVMDLLPILDFYED